MKNHFVRSKKNFLITGSHKKIAAVHKYKFPEIVGFPVENIVFHIFKIVNRINLTDMKFFFQSNTFVILHSFVTSEVINAENITFIIS